MDNYIKDKELLRLAESLDKIKLPAARTPVYKQKLKSALIDHARALRQPSGYYARRDWRFAVRRNLAFALPIAAILLLVAVWQLFIPAPQTYAHIVLEVNPTVRLRIDGSYNVAGFEAMDLQAANIFHNLDLRSMSAQQAVLEIVDRFYDQGLLTPERRMVLVIYPVAEVGQEYLTAALDAAYAAAGRRIVELNLEIAISRFVMDAQSYKAAEQAELMPSQYFQLLEAEVSPKTLAALFKAGEELKLDRKAFSAQFAAAADLIAEMLEAGLSEKEAVDIVRELLAAGAGIGLLEAAAENFQDRLDDGERPARAINKIRRAIKSGRLDELKGEDDRDELDELDDRDDKADGDNDPDKNRKDDENDENDHEDQDDLTDEYNDEPDRGPWPEKDQINGAGERPGEADDGENEETDGTGKHEMPDEKSGD